MKSASPKTETGWTMRGVVRAFLYDAFRHEAGCPKSNLCIVHKQVGKNVTCSADNGCHRFLVPEEPPVPLEFMPWLRRIFRLDSLRQVGCQFGMNDLPPDDWTALVLIGQERGRMEQLVMKARERQHKKESATPHDSKSEEALRQTRKLTGTPPPGTSIFDSGKTRKR